MIYGGSLIFGWLASIFEDVSRLIVDQRWSVGGIGRYAREVETRLGIEFVGYRGGTLRQSSPIEALRAGHFLRRSRKDAVWYSAGFVPPIWPGRTALTTVCDLMYLNPALASRAQRSYMKGVVARQVRRAPVVFTISDYTKRNLESWIDSSSVRVINTGCGIDESMIPESVVAIENRPERVVFVGGAKPNKNLSMALRGFIQATQRTELRGYELLVVGEVPDAMCGGWPSRVQFVGKMSDAELTALYASSRLLLMPSIDEGFGLPALESLLAGAPVVYGTVGPVGEIVGQFGRAVDVASADSVAAGIEAVLLNDLQVPNSVRRDLASNYRWDKVAAIVESELSAFV